MARDDGADQFVAFDLETTGLDPRVDRVIEIGAVRVGPGPGGELAAFESLIATDLPSSPGALAVHGIADTERASAPDAATVLARFLGFLGPPGRTVLLAHGATTDAGFLGAELARAGLGPAGHAVVDTLAWSRGRWPGPGRHNLGLLADRLGVDPGPAHRALADARRVVGLWRALRSDPEAGEPPFLYPIFDGRGPTPPPLGWDPVTAAIAAGRGLEIVYDGGTRGFDPRAVEPRGFAHRGGVPFLVAVCLQDGRTKEFRLDRVRRFEVRESSAAAPGS